MADHVSIEMHWGGNGAVGIAGGVGGWKGENKEESMFLLNE